MAKASRSVRIVNESGLHARPCTAVVNTALAFESRLRVRCGDREVDGRSILELMTLNASRGSQLDFSAEGRDAEELVDRLATLVEAGFEERG